jgi:hypothetical protein
VPVVLVHNTITREQYEESIRRLSGGKSTMTSADDWPVEGLLVHVTGEGPNGFRVVDVWESEDALQRFGAVLLPILEEIGVVGEPEIYPANTYVTS